jgi:hypothetical protein
MELRAMLMRPVDRPTWRPSGWIRIVSRVREIEGWGGLFFEELGVEGFKLFGDLEPGEGFFGEGMGGGGVVEFFEDGGGGLGVGDGSVAGGVAEDGAGPREVAEEERGLAGGGFEGGEAEAFHGAEEDEAAGFAIDSGDAGAVSDGAFVADEFGVLFGELEEALGVGIGFGVGFADNPERGLGGDGGLGGFEDAFAFGDGGGADEPWAAGDGLALEENFFDAVGDDVESIGRRTEEVVHELGLVGGEGDGGIGEAVGLPVVGRDEGTGKGAFEDAGEEALAAELSGGAGALLGEEVGEDNFDALLVGETEEGSGDAAEVMEDVGGLGVVPPAEVFDVEADFFEGEFGLLDLDLGATMGQHEGDVAVEKDFHGLRRAKWAAVIYWAAGGFSLMISLMPMTVEPGGISRVTTALAPMMECRPIVMPPRTLAPAPMKTSSSMTGARSSTLRAPMVTWWRITTPSPRMAWEWMTMP